MEIEPLPNETEKNSELHSPDREHGSTKLDGTKNPGKPHRCPRCFATFTRRYTIKQHFPGCIERTGNPQNLSWDDDPPVTPYDPAYSLYDPISSARKETGSERIGPKRRHRHNKAFILKKYKHGNLIKWARRTQVIRTNAKESEAWKRVLVQLRTPANPYHSSREVQAVPRFNQVHQHLA